MGKRIIQQARGKGSLTYRVRKKAYNKRIKYPSKTGEAELTSLIHSPAHSAPLMKLSIQNETFYLPAFNQAFVGQKITLGSQNPNEGDVATLKNIQPGTHIYNIERSPGDGGKMMRVAGTSATLLKKIGKKITILMPNKKEIILDSNCKATIGVIAGDGRTLKPIVKAGRNFHKFKAKGKLYPRVSAVAMNAIDHPFGSGRGKRIKSKIAKRNAPPGKRVGHLRPRKTGKRK
jgi:large subunit ribosomal protein L2